MHLDGMSILLILLSHESGCHMFLVWSGSEGCLKTISNNAISNLNTEAPIVDRACLAQVSLSPMPVYKSKRKEKEIKVKSWCGLWKEQPRRA
jgi:hypothetical protein